MLDGLNICPAMENEMEEFLNLSQNAPLALDTILINIGFGVILSILLRWHYKKFGSVLSNREEFALVCPFILLTTIFIIEIVQSSLALSLGLVGALSIVRFRTPIKEPEELAYLFLAVGMGLGLGANQTLPTMVAGPLILAVMAGFKWTRRESKKKNLYLSLDWKNTNGNSSRLLKNFNQVISGHVMASDLRRMDVRNNSVEATFFIDIEDPDKLSDMADDLNSTFSGIGITFIDQNQMPTV